MISLPTIQVHIVVENLNKYYHQVKENLYDFPDFSDHCPICGGKDCARFLGFYTREVIDENGTYYKDFPIARYKCYGKGKKKVSHITFSLLPHQLIPYTRYSILFLTKVLEIISADKGSIDDVLDYVAGLGKDDILSISAMKVIILKRIGLKAIERIQTSGYYKDIADRLNDSCIKQRLKVFVEYARKFYCSKTHRPIRGPCGLSYDFYLQEGSYYRNAQFLFSTPSQFR